MNCKAFDRVLDTELRENVLNRLHLLVNLQLKAVISGEPVLPSTYYIQQNDISDYISTNEQETTG